MVLSMRMMMMIKIIVDEDDGKYFINLNQWIDHFLLFTNMIYFATLDITIRYDI